MLFKICFLDISEFCLLRGLFEYFYQCRCDRIPFHAIATSNSSIVISKFIQQRNLRVSNFLQFVVDEDNISGQWEINVLRLGWATGLGLVAILGLGLLIFDVILKFQSS